MDSRTRFLLILTYATLVNTAFMAARVNVTLAALDFGAATLTVGLLMCLFALPPVLFSIHIGRWMDRVGLGIPMSLAAALMTAALVAAWLEPSLAMLFVTAPLVGLSFNAFLLGSTSAVGAMSRPEERAANFSWLALAGGVANTLGPLAAGHLAEALGHAAVFGLIALPPLLCVVAILMLRYASPPAPPAAPRPRRGGAFDLLREPPMVLPLFLSALMPLTFEVYSFIMPVYGTRIGLSPATIGNIMGTFGIAIFAARAAMPLVAARFDTWRVVTCSALLVTAVFFVFPFASRPAPLMALSFVFGLGFGVLQPLSTALLVNAAPPERSGEALGLRIMLQNSVSAVMPGVFGALGALGTLPVFWSVGAIMGAGGWLSKLRMREGVDAPLSRSPRR